MSWQRRGLIGTVVFTVGAASTGFAQPEHAAGVAIGTPTVLIAVAPQYPDLAVAARVQADVEIEIDISTDGVPKAVRPIKTHPLFEEASLVAARQWRFGPSQTEAPRCRVTFGFHLFPEKTPQSAAATRFMPPFRIEVVRVPPPATVNYSH